MDGEKSRWPTGTFPILGRLQGGRALLRYLEAYPKYRVNLPPDTQTTGQFSSSIVGSRLSVMRVRYPCLQQPTHYGAANSIVHEGPMPRIKFAAAIQDMRLPRYPTASISEGPDSFFSRCGKAFGAICLQ